MHQNSNIAINGERLNKVPFMARIHQTCIAACEEAHAGLEPRYKLNLEADRELVLAVVSAKAFTVNGACNH